MWLPAAGSGRRAIVVKGRVVRGHTVGNFTLFTYI